MALSENVFPKLYRTFRKRRNMAHADHFLWESICMSVTRIDDVNWVDPPPKEVHVEVLKRTGLIIIEYVDVMEILEKTRCIRFVDIEQTASPTVDTIILQLQDGEIVTFTFGTEAAKNDFYEAITIVSSDSGNSEG